jgi:hypothetical protein
VSGQFPRSWRDNFWLVRQPAEGRLSVLRNRQLERSLLGDRIARLIAQGDSDEFVRTVNENDYYINETTQLIENVECHLHDDFCWCEDCGGLTTYDNSINAYDQHRICHHCDGNYYYHEGSGYYVREDERDYSDEDDWYSGSIGDVSLFKTATRSYSLVI